jgi:two-component system, sensor histidine kinase YesM
MKRVVVFVKTALGNLQVKLLLIILIFLFTPVIFSINNYLKHTEEIIIDNTSSLIMDNLEQVGGKVENTCLDMITLSNIILTDDTILDNVSIEPNQKNYNDDFQMKDPAFYTNDDMSRITRTENEINSMKRKVFFNNNVHVIIIGADGNMYSSMDSFDKKLKLEYKNINKFLSQDWFETVKSGDVRVLWNVPYNYEIEGLGDDKYISIVKSIRNKYSPQNVAGELMINFSAYDLGKIIGNSINGYFAIINENSQIIYSSEKSIEDKILTNKDIMSKNLYYGSGSFFTTIDNEKFMVNYNSIKKFGMCSISLVPYKEIIKEIDSLKFKINSINILVFSVFLLLGTGMIMNTINPLRQLLKRMKKMKVGAYSVGIKENENLDDVNGLVHSFDNMLNRVEELVNTVVQEQKLENDLRYEALRAQINPHFLFNTLSTIKWSAKMSGADNVSKMISALGKLLEVSINKGEEEITLKEELKLAECYIYIQNVRYNDKFEMRININDESIYSCKMPKLILQPIVENCIIHGFEDKNDNCRIDINAYIKEESIVIEVIDNGMGMDADRIEHLLFNNENTKHKFNGIGLNNVHERIKLKYGQTYGLSITSEPERGTTVSISIPQIPGFEDEVV